MNRFSYKATLALILVLGLSLAPAHGAMTPRTAAKVQKAWELYEQGQISEGIAILEALRLKDADSTAYVARLLGSLYWTSGQPEPALEQLNLALDSGALDVANETQVRRMIADIHLTLEQFDKALGHYQWLLKQSISPQPFSLKPAELRLRLAQCHYAMEDWPSAAEQARLSAEAEEGADPYRLWLAAELQQKHIAQAEVPARALVRLEPHKGDHWRQLASLQLRQTHRDQALATMALAERHGVLDKADELVLLTRLYANGGMPELAARSLAPRLGNVVPDDLEHRVLLARYWQQASEWAQAIDAWGRAAELMPAHRLEQLALLVQQRHLQRAVEVLELADKVKLDRDARIRRANLAVQIHYLSKDYATALERAERLARLDASAGDSWRRFLQAKLM